MLVGPLRGAALVMPIQPIAFEDWHGAPLPELPLHLAGALCSPIAMESPRRAAPTAFGAGHRGLPARASGVRAGSEGSRSR